MAAGRSAGYGTVIGLDRSGDHRERLLRAGAHRVINSLDELQFART